MKKVVTAFAFLLSLSFISAYSYGYNNFSLGNILDSIDPSTAVLGALFFIFFIFINFGLSKFLDNKTLAGIGAFFVSFLIVYFMNKNLDIYSFVYGFRFYGIEFSAIFWWALVGAGVLTGLAFGWGVPVILAGLFWVGAGFIGLIDMTTAIILGLFFIVGGAILYHKLPKKKESALEKLAKTK